MEPESTQKSTTNAQEPRDIPTVAEMVKPFTEHLEDLRGVLIKSLLAVAAVAVFCFFFTNRIVSLYERPLLRMAEHSPQAKQVSLSLLRSLHPTDAFMIVIKVVLVTAAILASPIIFYFIWSFIRPGLKPNEQKMVLPAFLAGIVFFSLGVLFCYFLVLPLCLHFFWAFTVSMNIQPDWTIDNYISFVSLLLLAFGAVFEMPVLSAILAKFNLLTSKFLTGKRRPAYFIGIILAALLTPADVASQLMLYAVILGLYELSVFVVRAVEKSRQTGN